MSKKLDELIDKYNDYDKQRFRGPKGLLDDIVRDLVALKNILFPTPLSGGESVVELQPVCSGCKGTGFRQALSRRGDVLEVVPHLAIVCFCQGQGVNE